MTYNDLVYDILNTLGANNDDAVRSKAAVLFNIAMCMDRLKRERLEKELGMSGSRGSTDVMTTYNAIPVNYETGLKKRGYFTLPSEVYDIKQNSGIEYICYNRESGCADNLVGVHFNIATPSEVDNLDGGAFQKPRPAMPYYYRGRYNDGSNVYSDRVWLIGISPQITSVEIGVYLTVGDLLRLNPEENIDMPADMILLVKNMVLGLERWALAVPQEQLRNDGRGSAVGYYARMLPPATTSVNAPVMNPEA